MTARHNDTLTGVLHTPVPVPDLPPRPERIELSLPPVLVLAGLGVLVAVVFTWHVCAVIIGCSRSRDPIRTAVVLAIPMGALIVAAGITDTVQRHVRNQQVDRWGDLEYAAMAESVTALEDAYGITLTQNPPFVPVVPRDWPSEQPVTLADGTSTTCWFATTDGYYTILCGDTEDTATPLEPLHP